MNEKMTANRRLLIFIFLFALLIRLLYVFSISHNPLFDNPAMDAGFHDEWAQQMAKGDFAGYGAYFRSPLYAYLLGLIYALFGINYYIVRFIFAAIGSLGIVLIFKLTEHFFNRYTAMIAALIAGLSWTFIYYDGELLTEGLAIVINLAAVYTLVKAYEKPSLKSYFKAGLIFGIASLTRDNILPVTVIIFFWIIYLYREHLRSALKLGAVFIGGAILVISPVTIRNIVVVKDFIPISYYTGINFYIGNNPYSDGRTAIVPGTRPDWWGGVEDVHSIAESQMQRPLKPSEVSLFWAKKAFDYIASDFPGFLKRTIRKFLFIFDLNETSNNQNIHFFRKESGLLRLPVFFSSWFFIPLGILGLVLAIKEKLKKIAPVILFLSAYCIPLSLFFVYTRLRHPIMSFFIIFSAYAIYKLYEFMRSDKRRFIKNSLAWLGIFIFLGINSSSQAEQFKDGHFTIANAYMRKGNYVKAREEYNKALGLKEPYCSRTYFGLGEISLYEKKYNEAALLLSRSFYLDPSLAKNADMLLTRMIGGDIRGEFKVFGEVFFLIGNSYVTSGDYGSAELAYNKALALNEDAKANVNLGNLLDNRDKEKAITYYKRAMEMDKTFLPAYINLAGSLKDINRYSEALDILVKARGFINKAEEKEILEAKIEELKALVKRSVVYDGR